MELGNERLRCEDEKFYERAKKNEENIVPRGEKMNRFKQVILVLIIVLNVSTIPAEAKTFDPERITYYDLQEIGQERLRTSISVEMSIDISNSKTEKLGSGFIVGKKNEILFAVTCYHVVENIADSLLFLGMNTKNGKVYLRVENRIFDEGEDIAILKPKEYMSFFKSVYRDTTLDSPKTIGFSQFESNSKIIEGQGTMIIGYPLSLGCEYIKNQPILKIGIVAQKVNEVTGTFLIDSNVNPGNSGSPVYDSKNGKFIGMVTSYKNDNIVLYNSKGNVSAALPYNSGLTQCISAESILDIIKGIDNE